jgi:hypothetical protein
MNEKNMLGVSDWKENTAELEKILAETKEKLDFSRTIVERQKVSALQDEIIEGSKQVKAMNKKAYEVAIANQAEIKRLNDAAKKLRLESVDISVDALHLENNLKAKRVEMWQLEKLIKDAKENS